MPHSITGKNRTSRPDSRPNAKRRKKDRAAAIEAANVEDLRATRIPKNKQKERTVGGQLKQEALPPQAKRARYLQKLLRQIESLQERKEAGEKLDEAQLQKLGRMDEVVAEIEELFGVNLDSSEDEEEKADEGDKGEEEDDDEENNTEESSAHVRTEEKE